MTGLLVVLALLAVALVAFLGGEDVGRRYGRREAHEAAFQVRHKLLVHAAAGDTSQSRAALYEKADGARIACDAIAKLDDGGGLVPLRPAHS